MSSQPTLTEGSTIYCSACGHPNPSWRSECEACKTRLAGPMRAEYSRVRERPGCVTAYAILLWIAAALIVLGGIGTGINEERLG